MRQYPIQEALLRELLEAVEGGDIRERRFNRIEQAHFAELVRRGLVEPMGNGDYNLTDKGFEELSPGGPLPTSAAAAETATDSGEDATPRAPKRGLFKFNRDEDTDDANLPADSENV